MLRKRSELSILKRTTQAIRHLVTWVHQLIASSIILAILIFIVVNFYIFSSIVNINTFFYAFLLLSLLTDGMFVFLHLPRRARASHQTSFTAKKLTILIASHNGEDVIAETIRSAAVHVPLRQIVVVSDASTDNTVSVARATGARVIDNTEWLHKVGAINSALKHISTPYVLIMDDDTHIDKTFIPTSLLDDGFTAVAFNVMPIKKKTLVNELQQLEYRSTMQMSKHLRAKTGAIGNVSGAIGLYRTDDLQKQIHLHSGQFAGEDEQRTLLAHMYGSGKGITYTDSLVVTLAPATWHELFRQRAFSWSLSLPEQLVLYLKVILSPRFHYLLKAEKAYLIYIYVTEPLRILFFWALLLRPQHLLITYGFYTFLNFIVWIRLGRQDTLRSVLLSPIYSLLLTMCRFIGYFYWLKVKTAYLLKKSHRVANQRALLAEYAFTFCILIGSWALSLHHFRNEMHLFNKLRTDNLTSNEQAFHYDSSSPTTSLLANTPSSQGQVTILIEQGDSVRALAHKAVDKYLAEHPGVIVPESQRFTVDTQVATVIPASVLNQVNTPLRVGQSAVEQAIANAKGGHDGQN